MVETGQREDSGPPATALGDLARQAPEGSVLAAIDILRVAVDDRAKAPFVTRALHVLARLAAMSPTGALLEAASATSDTRVLLQALDHPNVLAKLGADDPLLEARVRGALTRQRLLGEEGGVCSAGELGSLLGGLTRQAIDKRRRHGKLIAIDLGRHGYGYPVWQIHRGTVLPGLERVIAELHESDPWTRFGFMLSPNSWLGGETPLATLRRGEVDRVVATAEMFTG